MITRCFVAVCAASLVASAGSESQAAIINDFNLIVTGNLNSTQEVEGRTFVGGNLTTGASNYGTMLSAAAFAGVDVLTVAGNINGGNVQIQAGNLRLGGSRTGNANFNGGGQQINDPTIATQGSTFSSQLLALSAGFASINANSTVQPPSGGQPGPLTFIAMPNANGLAVFSVTTAVLANNQNQILNLTANGATDILINVTGSSLDFTTNFSGQWASTLGRARTIWNFPQANSINLQRQWNGAILAPGAGLTNNTAIEGSVFVASFQQNGEVHLPGFIGQVPGPGAAALLLSGAVVAGRRRRS